MRERGAVSDVSRKVVPDKGSLNRERPVTKALKFPSCTRKCFFPSELERRVREGVYVMTGMVAGYHQTNGKQRGLS